MSASHLLRGACFCGRNQYVVSLPESIVDHVQFYLDNTVATRRQKLDPNNAKSQAANLNSLIGRFHAAPLIAFIRVPLSSYQSTTTAFYDDEKVSDIQRTYHVPSASNNRRQFCGYCGTQLSSWDERTQHEADSISLTVGSLHEDDVDGLEEMGIVPAEGSNSESEAIHTTITDRNVDTKETAGLYASPGEVSRGEPWFEQLVEQGRLGTIRRKRGGHTSRDGSVNVEWDVVELDGNVTYKSTQIHETTTGKTSNT